MCKKMLWKKCVHKGILKKHVFLISWPERPSPGGLSSPCQEMRTQRGSTCEFLLYQSYFYVTPFSLTCDRDRGNIAVYMQVLKSEMVDLRICDIQIGELEQEMAAKFADFERKTEDMPKKVFVNSCLITSHLRSLNNFLLTNSFTLSLSHTHSLSHCRMRWRQGERNLNSSLIISVTWNKL